MVQYTNHIQLVNRNEMKMNVGHKQLVTWGSLDMICCLTLTPSGVSLTSVGHMK